MRCQFWWVMALFRQVIARRGRFLGVGNSNRRKRNGGGGGNDDEGVVATQVCGGTSRRRMPKVSLMSGFGKPPLPAPNAGKGMGRAVLGGRKLAF